jgi:hypothetical protein
MKKILLAGMVVCMSVASFAQQKKGDINVTFSGTYTSNKAFSFGQIFAKGGYFITDHVEAGLKPQIMFGDGFSGFGLGAYSTYNFLTKDAKLVPYAGAELNYSSLSAGGEDAKLTQTNMGLYGGSKYFITENLNVDAGLNLSFNLGSNPDTDLGTIFQFQVGVGFIIGNIKKAE